MIRTALALLLGLAAPTLAQETAGALFARGEALYRGEDGRAPDPAGAAGLFYGAAVQGSAEAAHRLGLMYARGEGVEQDDALAYVWLARAAATLPPGEARTVAVVNRSTVAGRLTPEQAERVQAMMRPPQAAPVQVAAPPTAGPAAGWKGAPAVAAPRQAGRYRVQLGAFRSEAGARQALQTAQARHADLLKGLKLAILSANGSKGGRFYRVQAGPLGASAAERACDALRGRGADCLVVR